MLIIDFSIFSLSGNFVWQSRIICAILVEAIMIMRNIQVKLFNILDQWFRGRCCLKIKFIVDACQMLDQRGSQQTLAQLS